jgi:hypothetical protein
MIVKLISGCGLPFILNCSFVVFPGEPHGFQNLIWSCALTARLSATKLQLQFVSWQLALFLILTFVKAFCLLKAGPFFISDLHRILDLLTSSLLTLLTLI